MFNIKITFYDELVDFFSERGNPELTKYVCCERRSVKDLIESWRVPHTELGLILVDGNPVHISHVIQKKCQIKVYPFILSNLPAVDVCKIEEFKFLCDVHLGTLAKRLRLLGLDTIFAKNWIDEVLAGISVQERRYLLTRDRQLLMRKEVKIGLYIRNTLPEKQVFEVLNRLNLKSRTKPFSRCLVCNGILQPINNEESVFKRAEKKIPPRVKKWCKEYALCRSCDKVYWKGSHFEELKKKVDSYLA